MALKAAWIPSIVKRWQPVSCGALSEIGSSNSRSTNYKQGLLNPIPQTHMADFALASHDRQRLITEGIFLPCGIICFLCGTRPKTKLALEILSREVKAQRRIVLELPEQDEIEEEKRVVGAGRHPNCDWIFRLLSSRPGPIRKNSFC